MLSQALGLFFLKLSVGILPWIALINPEDTGRGFFRLILFLSFASALLVLVLDLSLSQWPVMVQAAAAFVLFSMIKELKSTSMVRSILALFILGVAAIGSCGMKTGGLYSFHGHVNGLAGALLLGAALTGMITGHWYLIRPRLPYYYLKRAVLIVLVCIVTRIFANLAALMLQGRGLVEQWIRSAGEILLATRFLWGVLVPLVFVVFAYQCAQAHSNRSATGILYFTTGAVFMGELIADFISVTTGIPL